jgi:Dockerin type I domain
MRTNRFKRHLIVEQCERRDAPSVSSSGANVLVNSITTGTQVAPAIAMDGDGDYVIAWEDSIHDTSGYGIFAQRFNAAGGRIGSNFQVNTYAAGNQLVPAIAMDLAGDSVIAWESVGQDGSGAGIYAQRYDSAGKAQGPNFRVNTYTTANQAVPSVAMDAVGNFVIVWESNGEDGDNWGVYGQRYNAAGTPLGNEFRINSYTIGGQFEPAVAMDYNGDFVVAWDSDGQDGSGYGIYAQRFNSAGVAQLGEFGTAQTTTNDQYNPTVAMNAAGDFVVAWQTVISSSVFVDWQKYHANGSKIGIEDFSVIGGDDVPCVARCATGEMAVARASVATQSIFVEPVTATGGYLSGFVCNTDTVGSRSNAAVAMDARGNIVVAWQGSGTDGINSDNIGVFSQRYVQSVDTAGPMVAGVFAPYWSAPITQGRRLTSTIPSLTVAFSEDMNVTGGAGGANSVTNPANWGLTQDGVSITNQITNISYALNNTTLRYEATLTFSSPLPSGHTYVLAAGTGLQDLIGNAIDGNYDGTRGDAFSRTFVIGAPVAVGPEFKVNPNTGPTSTTILRSSVSSDASGDYVVAWVGSSLSELTSIFAQTYSSTGAAISPLISVATIGSSRPSVAMDSVGNFIVAYAQTAGDGNNFGILARRYTLNGTSIGSTFVVNAITTGDQIQPTVALDAAGDMFFAWAGPGAIAGTDIFMRRFTATGTPITNDLLVNTTTTGSQVLPVIAADDGGDFALTWQGPDPTNGKTYVYYESYGRDGTSLIFNQQGQQGSAPDIAMNAFGDFALAWTSPGTDDDVLVQRYDLAGSPRSGVLINGSGNQQNPSVSIDRAGDMVVAYESPRDSTGDYGIYAEYLSGDPGLFHSPFDFHVNTFVTGDQQFPAVAMDVDGDFMVTWQSTQGGANSNIMAQRFAVPPPQVQSVQVNDGSAQRSRVTSLQVTFNEVLSFNGPAASAFVLTRQSDAAAVAFSANAVVNNGVTVVTLNNFTGPATDFGSLADGRYTLHVIASQVTSVTGSIFDGNGDGIGGDDYFMIGDPATNKLFRFYGDIDGDGAVSTSDFIVFRQAFNSNLDALDFENDGAVSTSDFIQFRQRFNGSI